MSRVRMTSDPVDVLVVGAGPVGLALALDVVAHGGTVRIVERRTDHRRPSRAMMVHPRTLEVLRPLGVVDALLARGDASPAADLHVGRRLVQVELGDLGWRGTAYPHLTMIRQLDVEEVLLAELHARGVEVEWGTGLDPRDGVPVSGTDGVRATVRSSSRAEQVDARFLVGADGTGSTVRQQLGIAWPGRYYAVEVVLADVELCGDVRPGRLQVAVGAEGLVFVFALGEGAPWRILATRPRRAGTPGLGEEPVPTEQLQELLDRAGLDAVVSRVAWSSRIPLQHRLAQRFSAGRVFLVGDAAHSHSPAAAQGMNSGIQDATNLGWKLAHAAAADLGPDSPLVESYQLERRPVARQVLALTDTVFTGEASPALLPRLVRGRLLPLVAPLMPWATSRRPLMSTVLWILSQGWVRYRSSPLSVDRDPGGSGPHPGDRLPETRVVCDGRPTSLHELTAQPGVHVLVSREAAPQPARVARNTMVHRLSSRPGTAVTAVRPDGQVGFRSPTGAGLENWLSLVGK
ncbi:monooxygenase [Intrasporangium chromatireducens Q5-1]|uniref:Monooxygenase n=1 Tax=Intrasporangium chromatireducens Q5-1 TaxID=584657 RepID=W9GF02_9MICO|nr:FAD-dependent monooxygenase [Intrasporangium chromatireducens]EWT04620.1 monooxygenase [Intrasporangium chromatireducens Q5-1]